MILLDNKKWYKRISTCFWFLLATLPFWLVSIISILSVFIHTDSVSFTLNDLNTYKDSFVSNLIYFQYHFSLTITSFFSLIFKDLNFLNVGIILTFFESFGPIAIVLLSFSKLSVKRE